MITNKDIKILHKQKSLDDIDYFLTDTLCREYNETNPTVLLSAALTSHNIASNHVCLDINKLAGEKWPAPDNNILENNLHQVTLPTKSEWIKTLHDSPLCNGSESPLVLDGTLLYLRRYFNYEVSVAEKLITLATAKDSDIYSGFINSNALNELLDILFPGDTSEIQKKAANMILMNKLLIISGGPGTGKTYTLARLIALLVTIAATNEKNIVIKMAAPTGKAAMRMRESIKNAKQGISNLISKQRNLPDIVATLKDKIDSIPESASTLHRLLGTRNNSPHFVYNAENQLPADILVIDEASMIDLPLMAKTLNAMQPNTKLILLGDMHQLSSVEPGYVLGDICKAAATGKETALGKSIIELTASHRFAADSPIGQLSNALRNAGDRHIDPDGHKVWNLLQELTEKDESEFNVRWHETPKTLRDAEDIPIRDFRKCILDNYKDFLNTSTPEAAFKALSRFRVFSPLRRGPYGVTTLNKLIEDTLSLKNMTISDKDFTPLNITEKFYDHRVIIISVNNYGLQLFNGDIGIIMPDKNEPDRLTAWFETQNEESGTITYRAFPCNMLPAHETAFAMTVHKSQGSQYEKIMVLIPPYDNEKLFTKELLYTAITRAEKEVILWCNEEIFKNISTRQTECTSGLRKFIVQSS